MVFIRLAAEQDKTNLENFLCENNGEKFRPLSKQYINACFSNDFRRPVFAVAIDENIIIGAIAFSEELFTTSTWGLSWVSVHKDFRNQGIGTKLIEYCLDSIKKQTRDNATIILATYPNQTKLYERLGFVISGKDHEDGSFMIKILNQ